MRKARLPRITERHWERLEQFAVGQKRQPSDAEVLIVKALAALGFEWQYVLAPYIADFYHPRLRIVVEVDGRFHEGQREADDRRTRELVKRYHCRVLRVAARDCFAGKALDLLIPQIDRIRAGKRVKRGLLGSYFKAKHKRKFKPGVSPGSTMSQWSHRAARFR